MIPRTSKYNAVKVEDDGYVFDSKQEHKEYCNLKLLKRAGEIKDLRVHPEYRIEYCGELICIYEADFEYYERSGAGKWTLIIRDVKAIKTPVYNLKKKLMRIINHIDITELNVKRKLKNEAKIKANNIR